MTQPHLEAPCAVPPENPETAFAVSAFKRSACRESSLCRTLGPRSSAPPTACGRGQIIHRFSIWAASRQGDAALFCMHDLSIGR